MYNEVVQLWNSVPPDLKAFVISAAAGLSVKVFPGKKDKGLRELFTKAYQEGMKHFVTSLGENCYYFVEDLLKDSEAQSFFVGIIKDSSLAHDTRPIEKIIRRIGVDTSTIEGFDIDESVASFLRGFNSEAENSEKMLTRLSHYKLAELVELKKREMKAHEAREPDLEMMRRRYFRYLKGQHSTLSFKGLSEGKLLSMPLKELYTSLSFSQEISRSEARLHEREAMDLLERSAKQGRLASSDILKSQYVVITGDPGSGKSTLLKYIALDCIEKIENLGADDDPNAMMPIIFPVAAYADACKKTSSVKYTLRNFIHEYFQGEDLPDLSPLFSQAWQEGNALFLMDGLDEVSDEIERRQMVDDVRNFIIADGDIRNKYIITCRTASYTKASRFEPINGREFALFSVQPFGIDEIREFLFSWYCWYEREINRKGENFRAEAQRDLDKMMDVITDDRNILSLATNPLMLTILALIEHEGGELPRNRADLYEKCLVMLAGSWNKIRSMFREKRPEFSLGERRITDDVVVEFLGPVATEMHENALSEIEYKELKKKLAAGFDLRNRDVLRSKEQAADFIRIMKEMSGILQEVSTGYYGFMHQTFKEYLAARVLTDLSEDRIGDLGTKLFTPEWKEVVLLTAASLKKRDASDFVRGIMKKETEHFENLALAGECVIDAGRDKIFDGLYDELVSEMERVISGHYPVEDRVAVGETLGRLGDPRDLKKFISVKDGIYELESGKISIEPFDMAKYPVANQWFDKFIEDDGYKKPEYWSEQGKRWLDYTKVEHPRFWRERQWNCPNSPVVGVCWYEADAFCRWLTVERDDGHVYGLPDANQWEAAAAGFEKRTYPWGNDWGAGKCNTKESNIDRTSPVGIFAGGHTPEGISDLAGNVWEWTRTDYHSKRELMDFRFDEDMQKLWDDKKWDKLISKLDEKDRQFPLLRGGSWFYDRVNARCAYRSYFNPDIWFDDIGFRCVRTSK